MYRTAGVASLSGATRCASHSLSNSVRGVGSPMGHLAARLRGTLAEHAVGDVQPGDRTGFEDVTAGALAGLGFAVDAGAQAGLAAGIAADAHAVHCVALEFEVDAGGLRQRGEQRRHRTIAFGAL